MRRFFGAAGPKAAEAPSLSETSQKMDGRVEALEAKVKALDRELLGYKQQLARTRSPSVRNGIQQKALRTLKQKKLYEKQLEQLLGQSLAVSQASFGVESMQDNVQVVGAMKQANATMKSTMKQMKIDDVEDVMDDMADLLQDHEEISEALGRTYGVDEIDDDELAAELDALGDELAFDEAEEPSYLAATSEAPTADPVPTTEGLEALTG